MLAEQWYCVHVLQHIHWVAKAVRCVLSHCVALSAVEPGRLTLAIA